MKSKKLTALLLSAAMAVSMAALPASAATDEGKLPFRDVSSESWYFDSVVNAYEAGIITGVEEDTFDPDGAVTREMFATMLGRTADPISDVFIGFGATSDSDYVPYTDISLNQWYSPYVIWANNHGVVKGVGNSTFGLGQAITREQMATMLGRFINTTPLLELMLPEKISVSFRDLGSVSDWALEGLELAQRAGLVQGDGNGNFNPQDTLTRAEAAAIFDRLNALVEKALTIGISPDSIGSISLRSLEASAPPACYDVTDPEEVAALIESLNAAPVISHEVLPSMAGWTYDIQFYDTVGNYLTGAIFSSSEIRFGNVAYTVEDDYFAPLIELANSGEPMS